MRPITAICVCLALAGCVTPDKYYLVTDAYWRITPVSDSTEFVEQYAAPGEMLFTQQAMPAEVIRLTSDASYLAIGLWKPLSVPIPAGTELYSVASPNFDVLLYCDPNASSKANSPTRACFADVDGDGKLELRYRSEFWGKGSYPSLTLIAATPGDSAGEGAFAEVTQRPELPFSIGLALTRSTLGAYRIRFALADGKSPSILPETSSPSRERWATDTQPGAEGYLQAEEVRFAANDLPLSLEMASARVELLGFEEDERLRYRVVSTFDPNTRLYIGHGGNLSPQSPDQPSDE